MLALRHHPRFADARPHHPRAPVRAFYTFYHSAHSPMLEEHHKAGRIMREDVLNATTSSADDAT